MKTKLLIIFWFLLLAFQINVTASEKEEVLFKKCIDGDTAVFLLKNKDIKVRFLAIDTKETVHPTIEASTKGKDASDYTCNKIKNAIKIELEYDPNSAKQDKYNRYLAWIWLDNYLLQKELIELGYAEVKYIYNDYLYTEELYSLQADAQKKRLGIWDNIKTYIVSFNNQNIINEVSVTEHNKVDSYFPEKQGYEFMGWYLNDELFDFDSYITKDIILIAKYKKESYYTDLLLLILILSFLFISNKRNFKRILKKKLKKII